MFDLNYHYYGKDRTVKIAEVTDTEGLENNQNAVYRSEKDQISHLKTIKGGKLYFTSFNTANFFDRMLHEKGFRHMSIFVKDN